MAGVAGVLALIVGILGCLAGYCQNCITSTLFMCLAVLIGFLALIAGGLIAFADWDMIKDQACETNQVDYGGTTGSAYMKAQYGEMVDDMMCSPTCPCGVPVDVTYLDAIDGLSSYGDQGREVSTGDGSSGLIPFCMSGEACDVLGNGPFTSYTGCFNDVISV